MEKTQKKRVVKIKAWAVAENLKIRTAEVLGCRCAHTEALAIFRKKRDAISEYHIAWGEKVVPITITLPNTLKKKK